MAESKPTTNGISYPQVGTIIDDGRLQLAAVIGTGGYGVVYQATDTEQHLYAVKCLIRKEFQRQSQLQEIALHQLASSHPGVVTLHRIVQDDVYMYMVMDYAPDQDLFVQILHKRRYLGNDALIKGAFLQLLDVIEYCHSLGIYHRDLKPENILCFENGRIALTDFGLATTQGTSGEFRTGSVYHMSPECKMVDLNFEGVYSPQSCDIWSLGIILLNMVTGRNPWKCASQEDPTFCSYFRSPYRFLSKILPISLELNDVLIMMLSVEWRARSSIPEIRAAVSQLETFYSSDAVFEGNLAKCPWETGVDLGTSNRPDSRIDISPPGEETDGNVTPSRSLTIGKDDIPLQSSSDPLSWWEDEDDTDDGWAPWAPAPAPSPSPPISQSETSSCSSDPSSPLTPSSTHSRSTSRSRPSTNSFISSLQSFFRLCSSPSLLREEKEYLALDPEAYTIDL